MARPQGLRPEQRQWLEEIGATIKRVREAQGMTQEQLGDVLVDRTYVARVERGTINISTTRLIEFARALGVPTSDLTANVD